MSQQDQDRAKEQAEAQLSCIRDMLAAASLDWERLEELRELIQGEGCEEACEEYREELAELEEAAGDYESQEEAEQAIYDNPLSIEYRSGWASSREEMQPEEFQILLCTGGPAVRIMGELDFQGEPYRAWFEYQDWGTPWTMLFEGQGDALSYAQRLIVM